MFSTYNSKYNLIEQNIEPDSNECIEKMMIHNGMMHADDVMSVWLMQQIYPDIEVVRTRDDKEIKATLINPRTIVADVGEGFYDHHQKDGAKYYESENGPNQMAACGIIWAQWGRTIINEWANKGMVNIGSEQDVNSIFNQFRNYVIRPIEVKDTTAGRSHVPDKYILINEHDVNLEMEEESAVSNFIHSFANEKMISGEDSNDVFLQCIEHINRFVHDYANSTHIYNGINPLVLSLTGGNAQIIEQARMHNNNAKEYQQEINEHIREGLNNLDPNVEFICLDHEIMDLSIFDNTNVKIVAYPDWDQTSVQIRRTNNDIQFTDERIKNQLGFDNVFVHSVGHMCALRINEKADINTCMNNARIISQDAIQELHFDEYFIEQKTCHEF